jgi:hypothetical protein
VVSTAATDFSGFDTTATDFSGVSTANSTASN